MNPSCTNLIKNKWSFDCNNLIIRWLNLVANFYFTNWIINHIILPLLFFKIVNVNFMKMIIFIRPLNTTNYWICWLQMRRIWGKRKVFRPILRVDIKTSCKTICNGRSPLTDFVSFHRSQIFRERFPLTDFQWAFSANRFLVDKMTIKRG